MARAVGRLTAAGASGLSLLVALGFFTAASRVAEAPASAVAGGTLWVFILSMIVSTPAMAAWTRRRSSGSRPRGGAA